jgi:hypothetical protein
LFVDLDATARDAMALMSNNNVLSLPVWDKTANQFVCFISVVDLLRFCIASSTSLPASTQADQDDDIFVRQVVKVIEVDEETQVEIWSPQDSANQVRLKCTTRINRKSNFRIPDTKYHAHTGVS